MPIRQMLWPAVAVLISMLLYCAPAQAQATRTWVSGVGDDVNPCSRTAPCKTFAGAISKTAAGGEINCLDPGGYGTLTITKSITVDCTGTMGSTLNSGGINGFVINDSATASPGTIVVTLRNLKINGAGSTPGLNGVRVISGKTVYISNSFIEGQNGSSPGGCGISMAATTPVRVFLRNVEITRSRVGVCVTSTGISNSMFIENSTLEGNTVNSMVLSGANTVVALFGSVLTPTGVSLSGGASLISSGNNRIAGAVGPTTIIPLQ